MIIVCFTFSLLLLLFLFQMSVTDANFLIIQRSITLIIIIYYFMHLPQMTNYSHLIKGDHFIYMVDQTQPKQEEAFIYYISKTTNIK